VDHLGHLVHQDSLAHLDRLALLVTLERWDHRVSRDRRAPLEFKAHLVRQDNLVQLDQLDL